MNLLEELQSLLGNAACVSGSDVPEAARSDESHTGTVLPSILLRPASVAEIAAALEICFRHGQAVVPQGGMTGLAGGANARPGDVALSLSRFAGVEEIDPISGTMLVRAGTSLEIAQKAAEDAGLLLPIDLGSRGSCQIGGLLATNAGGLKVIRYGTTRANVLGIETVKADGTVLSHLNRMTKDNTGFDLRSLMIGSEGTLGIVTRAVLKLWPRPSETYTALCALPSPQAAIEFLQAARATVTLQAFEAMWPDYFAVNCALEGHRFFEKAPPMTVIIEAENRLDPLLEKAFEDGLILDALPARSTADGRRFWDVREGHRLDQAMPGLVNFDVSLDIARMPDFVETTIAAVRAEFPTAQVLFFGHLGDGNLHAVVHVEGADRQVVHEVDRIVYGEVRAVSGSISAEHGIGTLKRDWLGHSRTNQELATMRAIKAALDPRGILNPGKLL